MPSTKMQEGEVQYQKKKSLLLRNAGKGRGRAAPPAWVVLDPTVWTVHAKLSVYNKTEGGKYVHE
jgi:hypothetical protein